LASNEKLTLGGLLAKVPGWLMLRERLDDYGKVYAVADLLIDISIYGDGGFEVVGRRGPQAQRQVWLKLPGRELLWFEEET